MNVENVPGIMFIRRRLPRRLCKKEALLAIFLLFVFFNLITLYNVGFNESISSRNKDGVFLDHLRDKKNNVVVVKKTTRVPTTAKPVPISHKAVNKTRWFRPDKSPSDPKYNCDTWFHDSFEENLNVIKNYPRGIADQFLWKIGGNRSHPNRTLSSFPVIVTAANSGFYGVTQGLLKSIHEILMPKYKDIKIIYYDLGLGADQHQQLVKYCKCEVRKFPFDDFPPHVRRLKTYTWKPIIIQQLLMEFGFVWWADSSVRFTTDDLDRALDYTRKNSFLIFTYAPVFAVAFHTDAQTMKYLGEDPCKFRHFGENEATFVLFHYDEISRELVKAWAACALNEDCMCPAGTSGKLSCNAHIEHDGRCHRFDQAVLSILFRRLYHDINDYPLVDAPFRIHKIMRGNSVSYFPH